MNTKRFASMLFRPFRRRPSRRSRGSVLILVVALLVLMALIGTAWISTARVDRAAAITHTSTTEVELLLDGVVNMAISRIVSDVYDNGVYRHYARTQGFDDTKFDDFIASRIPVLRDEAAHTWVPPTSYTPEARPTYAKGVIVHDAGSFGSSGQFYLCKRTHRAEPGINLNDNTYWEQLTNFSNGTPFDPGNPPTWPAVSRVLPPNTKFSDIQGAAPDFWERGPMAVVTKQIAPGGPYLPAFEFYPAARRDGAPPAIILAADTDGDGIADANYFKLPVGRINGLDYYAAIRIVDNNSAVNVAAARGDVPGSSIAHLPSSLNLFTSLTPGAGLIIGPNTPGFQVRDQELRMDGARMGFDGSSASLPDPHNDFGNVGDRRRDDFDYASVEQLLQWQLLRRMENPGYVAGSLRAGVLQAAGTAALAYRGGTLINPDAMYSDFSPSSQIEQFLNATLYYSIANHPGLGGTMARRTSYLPDQFAWRDWFVKNFDYRQIYGLPAQREQPNLMATYRNRRALMVASNPLSSAIPNRYNTQGDWIDDRTYDVGDYVWRIVDNRSRQLFVCISPIPALAPGANRPPGEGTAGLAVGDPRNVLCWEPRMFNSRPTKVSVSAGTYGELFLAFWQVMAESFNTVLTTANPEVQVKTPFKEAYLFHVASRLSGGEPPDVNVTTLLDTPYYGSRFNQATAFPTPANTTTTTLAAQQFGPHKINPSTAPDQHPLRMFRSPLRAVPDATGDPFKPGTPRLMTDHTMRLRAALAAVNTIDMRDNDDNVTARELSIGVTVHRGGNALSENDDTNRLARVRVYGHERQPFITEVFAQSDIESDGPRGEAPNPYGYVAIELHNPYGFPIDIRHCKLATITRVSGSYPNLVVSDPGVLTDQSNTPLLANAVSNMADMGAIPPTVIPANGYLVLENYLGNPLPAQPPMPAAARAPANFRPPSSGMPPTGAIPMPPEPPTPRVIRRNHAYVPNLHTVMDKEVVLLRPLDTTRDPATGGPPSIMIDGRPFDVVWYGTAASAVTPAVDMAPLDSFDFTGLPNADDLVIARINADAARGNSRGSGHATPRATPTTAYAWHYARASDPATKPWRFVYPGRYDAHPPTGSTTPRPRHQGTYEAGGPAGWDAGATGDPWDAITGMRPDPAMTLVEPYVAITVPGYPPPAIDNATYYPHEYVVQLNPSIVAAAGAAGAFPPVALTGNFYPFGGFARNGDILSVPYIGSYMVKLTPFPAPRLPGQTNRPTRGGTDHFTSTNVNVVLELNAITMDAAMAEDTDPVNHYGGTVTAAMRPEQIGRFTPSLEDLEVAATGVIEGTAGTNGLIDTTHRTNTDPPAGWAGFELVVTDGPGKGQVRTVVSSQTGQLTVIPPWEGNVVGSTYMLRRGTMWRDTTSPPPLAGVRTSGNKAWAMDLLDYLAVDTPQNDHFPPADPSYVGTSGGNAMPPHGVASQPGVPAAVTYGRAIGSLSTTRFGATANLHDAPTTYINGLIQFVTGPLAATGEVHVIEQYDASGSARTITVSNPGFSGTPNANDIFRILMIPEDMATTQGLININTAPWPVLAMVPWVEGDATANALIAQAICRFRDGDPTANLVRPDPSGNRQDGSPAPAVGGGGPFRSIFDLYRVPEFLIQQNLANGTPANPTVAQGDLTFDTVRHDYEEHYLMMNRVSNMITTRSDTFTCYVLVQGWRNAGDPAQTPELVVQRRRAFTIDRSGLTNTAREPAVQFLYND